jgi:DNA-binding NarL/FixJ family response regulator
LTRCLAEAERWPEAERASVAARACADDVQLPMAGAMADCAAAIIDRHAADPARAAERALSAATALEEVGAVFDAANARKLAGRALVESGERDEAAVQFRIAAGAFDSFGSTRYRDEAELELRRLGARIHRRTRPGALHEDGIAALTARELEVARLVVDRKTNPEIAAELFLSLKTVETHLRNTFRKLSVASRVELARAVERADRAAAS